MGIFRPELPGLHPKRVDVQAGELAARGNPDPELSQGLQKFFVGNRLIGRLSGPG
jgi:hypothetical protein